MGGASWEKEEEKEEEEAILESRSHLAYRDTKLERLFRI